MEKETKLIEIPKEDIDTKYIYFPAVSKEIMQSFFNKINEPKIVSPSKPERVPYTFCHVGKNCSEFCKCKLRIEMPKENTFLIDTNYVKKLIKFVQKRNKDLGSNDKALIIFPVINERKIYMINAEKIDKKKTVEQFVNNTYAEKNTKRRGKYYVIKKQSMTEFKMPDTLQFYTSEKEEEKIIEKLNEPLTRNLF